MPEQRPTGTTTTELQFLRGPRGHNQRVIAVPVFRDGRETSPQGRPGRYRASFILSKPRALLRPERTFSFDPNERGDSHLLLTHDAHPANPAEAEELRLHSQQGDGTRLTFAAVPNKRGALGRVESEPYDAADFVDAERRAWDALMPALSGYAAHLDMPLNVEHVVVIELATNAMRATAITPFFEAPIVISPQAILPRELRAYVSVYREGMNSNSSTHQFLCFYKIIESVRARRERIQGERLGRGEPALRYQHERIPADRFGQIKWVQALFPFNEELDESTVSLYIPSAASGRKLNHIIDNTLRPLRDSIAHAIFDENERELRLSTDSALDSFAIDEWLPLTKCIARRNLKNDFAGQFLASVPELL